MKKYVLIILAVAFITMLPLFTSDYKSSHDTKFHLTNIDSLTEQIKKDFFNPSKIVGNIGNDFGYGTNLFYPSLSHYVASYINVVIDNPVISVEIVYFISLFLSGISMFLLSKALSKNDHVGLISAIIYMLFPYHLSDIYIRDAIGESLLFVFLPLILLGLYELFNDNKKKFYIFFVIGYVGGILSHLTMMTYFTILILIFLIFKYKKSIKYIKQFVTASIFILTITSPFLVALLQQRLLGNYNVFMEGVMVQGTWGNALNILKYIMIGDNWGTGETRFYIDLIVLILLFLTLKKYKQYNNKYYNCILIFGIISLILSSKLFPWDLLPKSFRIIQFPWRFVTFVSLSISILAPLCISKFNDKKMLSIILIIFMVLLAQPNLKQASNEVIDISNIEQWYGMGWQREYLPVSAVENSDYFDNRNHDIIIKEGNANVEIINNDVPYLEFKVDNDLTVELPRIYYIGYTLLDENNNKISFYENEYGFIEVKLESGTYKLDFTGTKYDELAKIVSIISIIGFGVFVWRKK